MTDSTDNALKPCPFCGGVGHMAKDPDMNWGDFYSIKCGTCRAKSPEFHASETCPIFFAQVRDAWNRRADLPPTDAEVLEHPKVRALVDAAEEQLDYLEMCGEDDDLVRNLRAAIAELTGGKDE